MNERAFPASGGEVIITSHRPELSPLQPEVQQSSVLLNYWRVLNRWRWVIVGGIVLGLVAGIVITLMMTRMYNASVTLEISREDNRLVSVRNTDNSPGTVDLEFYQTQYGLLKSRSLAERVARELHLGDDTHFFTLFRARVASPNGALTPDTRTKLEREAASILLQHVVVTPGRASRLVTVSFESPDPAFSAQVVNAWVRDFIQSNLERKFAATAFARDFLEQRLRETRQHLDDSERRLVDYARKERIISVAPSGETGVTSDAERSLAADDLSAQNGALAAATSDRIKAESRWRQAVASPGLPEDLSNPTLSALRQQRAVVAADYSKMIAQFTPAYPLALALFAQGKQLDEAIAREEARVRNAIKSDYLANSRREEAQAAQVEQLKTAVLDVRRRSIQYNIYQRDVDTNRSLYDGLLQRYKEIGVAGGVGANNVSIVDAAEIPEKPSRPRPLLNVFLALLSGLAAGIAVAFGLEQIDESISEPADLERALSLPVLGTIPRLEGESPMEALQDRTSNVAEAYLSVQTSLLFSTAQGMPKSLVVTSTRPSEGKSTSAFAIAQAMARQGTATLLIDGDMRSPSVHSLFQSRNVIGLSNLLSSGAALSDVVNKSQIDGLSFVTSGALPPNAAELLSGTRMREVIAEALRQFDYVVIDAPPVMGIADAPLIANCVAGIVFVVESHGARSRLVKMAIARLLSAHGRLLGSILTKFNAERADVNYGYFYGYGYGKS